MIFSIHLHREELPYWGPELRPHFILSQFRVEGSALAAFLGPCDVKTDHLVDWEDRLVNDTIRSARMVHFLGEFFGITLREGVWLQRLLIAQIFEDLTMQGVQGLRRDGDDLFIADRKLSVSIVTASAVSVLLHAGINVDASGAPVPAVGLEEFELDPIAFAQRTLERFSTEWESVFRATTKVRPV